MGSVAASDVTSRPEVAAFVARAESDEPTTYDNDDLAGSTSDALALFLRDIRQHPLLTKEEEVELAQAVERGDLEAKERMINSNLRLVVGQVLDQLRELRELDAALLLAALDEGVDR